MLRLVRDVAAEITTDDDVPRGVEFLVELLLDISGDVLFNVVFLERLRRAVYGILLHFFRHVGILDHRLSVRHVCDLLPSCTEIQLHVFFVGIERFNMRSCRFTYLYDRRRWAMVTACSHGVPIM